MNEPMAERLDRVEATLAHLERQHEQLNEVVIEQGRILKRLAAQQLRLSETVENEELARIKSTNPKPPHFQ